jgi:tetratricopeptide (TPR) repeat protein
MSNALSFDELIARASQAANNGDWNGTLAYLLEANKSLPGQVELISAIGGTLIQLGRVEEALPYYQQALMIDKKNPSAYLNLANTLSLLKQWEAAEQTYRKGIELDDENRFLWKGLARVCLNQGKNKEGVEILAALVTSDETDTEALLL